MVGLETVNKVFGDFAKDSYVPGSKHRYLHSLFRGLLGAANPAGRYISFKSDNTRLQLCSGQSAAAS